MDVFDLRLRLVEDYGRYIRSFIKIADPRIQQKVDGALDDGALWPEPLLQLNPTFLPGGTIDDLVADGALHSECAKIFRVDKSEADLRGKPLLLHTHQTQAIRKAKEGKMASEGTSEDQKRDVAGVATLLFGARFEPDQVIGETLERATPEIDCEQPDVLVQLADAVASDAPPPSDYESFRTHPLASWIESTFGVETEPGTSRLTRRRPRTLRGEESAVSELARLTGAQPDACCQVLQEFLKEGSELRRSESSRFPIFAFRLHQFFTRADTVWSTVEPEDVRHLEMAKLGSKPGEPDTPLTVRRPSGTNPADVV